MDCFRGRWTRRVCRFLRDSVSGAGPALGQRTKGRDATKDRASAHIRLKREREVRVGADEMTLPVELGRLTPAVPKSLAIYYIRYNVTVLAILQYRGWPLGKENYKRMFAESLICSMQVESE